MSENAKKPCVRCGYKFSRRRIAEKDNPLCQSCMLTLTESEIAYWSEGVQSLKHRRPLGSSLASLPQ